MLFPPTSGGIPRFAHSPPSPLAVASILALLLLSGLASAPAAPAMGPSLQLPPTSTPIPDPRPGGGAGGGGTGPVQPGGGGGGGGTGPLGPGASFGDPHLTTLDGFGYDFQAAGEFVLVASTTDDLAVQVRQEPWPGSSVVSITTAVAMTVAGDRVGLSVGAEPHVRVNGAPTPLESGSLSLPQGGRVAREGAYYTIVWPDQSEVAVGVSDQYLDLIVRLAAARAGQVVGLLGNADGDPANDLATRDGTVVALAGQSETDRYRQLYGQFGRSWRIGQAESLFEVGRLGGPRPGLPRTEAIAYAQPGFPTALMPSALIEASDLPPEVQQTAEALCREAGVVAADFLLDCVLDVGLTGEAAFAASTAEIEALFAPADTGPALRVYQFSGPLSARGAEVWISKEIGFFSQYSGTVQMRVGIDPDNLGDPVQEFEVTIELHAVTFEEDPVFEGSGSCSLQWATFDPPLAWWDAPDELIMGAEGGFTSSCTGRPVLAIDPYYWHFRVYVVDESTLALCPRLSLNDPGRDTCVANPAAVLVEVPRTP